MPLKLHLKKVINLQICSSVNGLQGLEAYRKDIKKQCCQKNFHFILMDMQMPIMDGLEASKRIVQTYNHLKGKPEYSHIKEPKIFAVTAFLDRYMQQLAVDNHILDVLIKPVEKKDLIKCLKKHLDEETLKKILRN